MDGKLIVFLLLIIDKAYKMDKKQ